MRVKREIILTPDFLIGNIIGLCILLVIAIYLSSALSIMLLWLGISIIFVFIAQKKYLREIRVDTYSRIIEAQSIYPFINYQIVFADLEAIKTTNSISLFVRSKYHFVIRRKRKILPLIFEVRTEFEDREVQEIVKKLLEIMPEKVILKNISSGKTT